jgi:tetratricopeptide (TPR) repeat protein
MNLKPLSATLLIVSLSACAQSPTKVEPAPGPVKSTDSGLTSKILYQLLLGEIASQRGELRLSAEAYADLAVKTRDARVAQRATELAMYARMPTLAMRDAQVWRDADPDSVKAIQNLASFLIANGRPREAKPHLEAWLKLKDPAEVFAQLHALFARQKDKQAVLDLVSDLASVYPALPEARFAVAQIAIQAGQMPRAMSAMEEALRLRPQWESAVLFKAQVLLKKDGEGAALGYLAEYLKSTPDAREVRVAYAKQLARAGRFAESRVEFEQLTRDEPDNPETYFTLGLIAMQTNDLASARTGFLKALELGYADPDAVRYYLGQLAEADKNYEEARKWFQQVSDGRQRFDAQLRVAVMLSKQGKLAEAREWLSNLPVEEDAERVQVVQTEALLLREAKNLTEAYEVLSRALAKMPDSQELLYDHAMAAEKLDHLDVLEKDLRHLIQINPNHAHAYNALGYTLADRTDRLKEAVELLDQALKLSPDDPYILDSMGWALFKMKRLTESVDYLRRAYATREDPDIAAHLGEALWVKGDKDEARKIWQGSLKSNPENESLREVVSRLMP